MVWIEDDCNFFGVRREKLTDGDYLEWNQMKESNEGGRLFKLGLILSHNNIKDTIDKGRWVEAAL